MIVCIYLPHVLLSHNLHRIVVSHNPFSCAPFHHTSSKSVAPWVLEPHDLLYLRLWLSVQLYLVFLHLFAFVHFCRVPLFHDCICCLRCCLRSSVSCFCTLSNSSIICLSSSAHSVCCLSHISSSSCNFHAYASSLSNCLLHSSSTNLCSLASCCQWKSSLILASIDSVSLPCLFTSLRNCSNTFFISVSCLLLDCVLNSFRSILMVFG